MADESTTTMMANLSSALSSGLNLSGQSLDLLRRTLCNGQSQQQNNPLEKLVTTTTTLEAPTSSLSLLMAQQAAAAAAATKHHSQAMSSYIFLADGHNLIPNEHPVTKFVIKYLLKPMSSLDASLDYYSSQFWQQSGDPRSGSLPFMSGGPWKLLYATMIYLYLVKILLPRTMRNRPALELSWPLRGYNLLMIVCNCYAFYHGCRLLDFGRKCFGCVIIDHQDYSHPAMELLNYGWLFFLSRLVEWVDTIFFVLRKKENQVTKLHVFHHSFVPLISWTYLKYHPGITMAFFPLVNTFVHTIMYSYYFLATFGPAMQPHLWWKKYLTSLQIAQFVLIIIQLATISLSTNERCQYPRGFLYTAFAGAILFLWLFYTYYIDTYKNNNSNNNNIRPKQQVSSQKNLTDQQQQQQQQQHSAKLNYSFTGLVHRKTTMNREGSSRALWDSIENSISMESAGDGCLADDRKLD